MTIEIRVPTLGESVTEATVARWLKQPGETITRDEPVVELETDKVTLEVPAPAAGTLGEIRAGEGTNVPVGAVLGIIADGAAGSARSAAITAGAAPHPGPLPVIPGSSPGRERGSSGHSPEKPSAERARWPVQVPSPREWGEGQGEGLAADRPLLWRLWAKAGALE